MAETTSKTDLENKYQAKGAQRSTLQEYIARQKKAEKTQFKLPKAVKYVLLAPVLLLFCFGVFFIPYMIFKAATSPSASSSAEKTVSKK